MENKVLANGKGELRAKNYQVVSAPCRHPSGNYYEVIKDLPLKKVTSDFIMNLISPYLGDGGSIPGGERVRDTTRSGEEIRKRRVIC